MTITTIILESDDVVPVRISGVIVRLYTTSGVFVSSGTTDIVGSVIFDVPDADYDVTFFKQAVSALEGNIQRITVSAGDTDDPPNTYLVLAHITDIPESVNPLVCRISGYVLGLNGQPTKDFRISFGMCPDTAVLEGNIIAPQATFEVYPNSDGYFEFDLLRMMKYTAYFHQLEAIFDHEPAAVFVVVPDLPALLVKDLLFPVPVHVDFEVNTLSLAVGAQPDDSVGVTITYSDGSINQEGIRPVPPWFSSVSAVSSNIAVATVEFQVDKVVVTPIAAGTASISFTRTISKKYLIYDPEPAFVTETLTVTVA